MAENPTPPRAPKGTVFRRPAAEIPAVTEVPVAEIPAVTEMPVADVPVSPQIPVAEMPVSSEVPGAELPMGSALSAELDSIQADIAARPLPVPERLEEEARQEEALHESAVHESVLEESVLQESVLQESVLEDPAPIDRAGTQVLAAVSESATGDASPELEFPGTAGVRVPPLIRAESEEARSNQPPPLGLEELILRFGEMMWLEARLYEVVGYWATIEENNEVSVLFAEVSRHHGWHAELWASAMPDVDAFDTNLSVRPPHNGWVKFFQTLVEMNDPEQTADRVAALALVADPWIRIRNEQLSTAANAVSDRAIQRIQRFVLIDHDEDHQRLIKALTYLPGGPVSDVAERLFPLIGDSH